MNKLMRVFLSLVFILIIGLDDFSQSNVKIDPLYLGITLIDQPNVEKMAGLCKYYELNEMPDQDGFKVFRHSNGTEFRFKVDKDGERNLPIVIVETNEKDKTVDYVLSNVGYVKEGKDFVKGTKLEQRRTRCKVTGRTHKTLTFEKEYNNL